MLLLHVESVLRKQIYKKKKTLNDTHIKVTH